MHDRFRFEAQERAPDGVEQERMPWIPVTQLEGYLLARGGGVSIVRVRLCDKLRPKALLIGRLAEEVQVSLLTPDDVRLAANAIEVVLARPKRPGLRRAGRRAASGASG